jgi:hypothetical protein
MLSNIEKALFLKTVNLFESMTPEQLKILTNISEEVNFQTGEILFSENDPADYLYVIVDGEIEIVKNYSEPGEIRLALLHSKASFGELTLFGDEGRSATAIASKDSTFLAIEKEHLLLLIQENPAISTSILFQLADMIRELNKAMPVEAREKAALESASVDGTGGPEGKDLRKSPRFFIPGIVEVLGLSTEPIFIENVSEGGAMLTLPSEPDPKSDYRISVRAGGQTFDVKVATVVWKQKDEQSKDAWKVGLKWEMPEEEKKKFLEELEKAKNK